MKKACIALLLLVCSAAAASAQVVPGIAGGCGMKDLTPFAFEQIVDQTASTGFTAAIFAPAGQPPANMAMVSVETNTVRYREDGVAPTAGAGHLLAVNGFTMVCGEQSVRKVRFIRTGANATITVSYYRTGDQ